MRHLLLLILLPACGTPEVAPLVCPENTVLEDVRPVGGGRVMFCARKNGVRQGPWVEYDAEGVKRKEGAYDRNRRSGTFRWWHPNGQLMEEAQYLEGKLDGTRTQWNEQGEKTVEERYAAGEIVTDAK